MSGQLSRVPVYIDVGREGHVVALALEEAQQVDLVAGEEARVVGPVEGDLDGGDPVRARVRVQTLAAPRVVGLQSVHRRLDQDRRVLPRRRAHDHRHIRRLSRLRTARQQQLHRVVATRRIGRHGEGVGHRPAGAQIPGRRIRGRNRLGSPLLVAPAVRQAADQAAAGAAVPAQPVDLHPVARGRIRAHMQIDRLTRQDTHLRAVSLDRVHESWRTRDQRLPAGRPGLRVLDLNGVRTSSHRCGAAPAQYNRDSEHDHGGQ